MPISKKEEGEDKEEEKLIPSWLIHPSNLIESEYSKEVMESSRRDGIRYPIIVRPCKCEFIQTSHYEIVGGHSRHAGMLTNKMLKCKVIELTDEEALREMYICSFQKPKSAYWKSQLIGKMVGMKEKEFKEKGIRKGAKTEVAKTINKNNVASGQVLVSQYRDIYELFNYLKTLKSLSHEDLMRIKSLDKDNLLLLAHSDRGVLLKTIEKWLENPKMSILEVKRLIVPKDYSYRAIRREKKRRRYRPRGRRQKPIELKPDVLDLSVTSDLVRRIRRIAYWIEGIFEKELRKSKFHWTKRNKILEKFVAKQKSTLPEIALECLLMGIEDVENGMREGSINLHFEVVGDVPIGYRGIFKERAKLEKRKSMEGQHLIKNFTAKEEKLPEIKLEPAEKKIKLEFEDKEKDKN